VVDRHRLPSAAAWVLGALLLQAGIAGEADSGLLGLAETAGQTAPVVRIGLDSGHRIEISSKGPYRVIDPRTGRSVWRESFREPVQFVAEGGPKGGVPTVYRVQVGAFATQQAAEAELQRLEQALGVSGVVRHNPDRGNWRVRLGRAEERLALNRLLERIRAMGLEDIWIAEEPADEVSGVVLRLVDESYESRRTELSRLAVIPAQGQRVEVAGRPYRGVLELRVTPFGTVRAINWVNLEQYLLGVVPAELGPEVWPELQALQAQAVAARTYIWRNRGQFEDEGFDICDQPRCQVYKGVGAEHPLSDRAVWGTRGQVLTHGGKPIVALYSATCGGHTEDGAAIFAEHPEPYLKGVPCRAENDAIATLKATVEGRALQPRFDETGTDVTRDWALLLAAGVIRDADAADAPLRAATLREWTLVLAKLAGLDAPAGAPTELGGLGDAAVQLLADLGWSERAEVLLSRDDLPALLRDEAALQLPPDQRRAVAYLAWVEALRPFSTGSFGVGEPPSRGRIAPATARIGEAYRAFGLREAVISGMGKTSIRLVQGKGEIRLPFADAPMLFGRSGGRPVTVERLELWPGDRVRFRTGASGGIDFLELRPPVKGASDDRSAAVYAWDERKSRNQLERAINRRVSVGKLRDLKVVRRGVSGRVVELEVVGSKARTVVRGFDVRRLLDLRDILTVFEIQRDAAGEITAVVFSGKGWGHGVGLCQVGAYGMALRGADYREILAHYYRSTSLEPLSVGR